MHWTKAENVIWEELDGGALVVDTKTGARWTLNVAAAAVWKHCDGTRSVGALAQAFARTAGRNYRELRGEIAAFCDRLGAVGMLQPLAAPRLSTLNAELCFHGIDARPAFQSLGLTQGSRRRPSPRGNSGPG